MKLEFTKAIEIQCAHRVGEKAYQGCHLDKASKSEEQRPGPIIAKITSWKVKERILQEERSKRPQGVINVSE